MDAEVRRDEALLTDVPRLLGTKAPFHTWGHEAVAALAEAVTPRADDAIERAKAERLERHLLAGPPPEVIAGIAAVPSRPTGCARTWPISCLTGLYLVAELG